jgi:hypothetical protein
MGKAIPVAYRTGILLLSVLLVILYSYLNFVVIWPLFGIAREEHGPIFD